MIFRQTMMLTVAILMAIFGAAGEVSAAEKKVHVDCKGGDSFFSYCLEYSVDLGGTSVINAASISTAASELGLTCNTSNVQDGACGAPNCWDHVLNYGCIDESGTGVLSCGKGSSCNKCTSAPISGKSESEQKSICEAKNVCSFQNGVCIIKSTDGTTDSGDSVLSPDIKSAVQSLNMLNINTAGTGTGVAELIGRVIRIAMGLIGSIALVMLVSGGVLWMSAAGNSDREKKAMNILVWSGLGLGVILASFALSDFVFEAFR